MSEGRNCYSVRKLVVEGNPSEDSLEALAPRSAIIRNTEIKFREQHRRDGTTHLFRLGCLDHSQDNERDDNRLSPTTATTVQGWFPRSYHYEVCGEAGFVAQVVVHSVVDGGLVENYVATIVSAVVNSVVGGSVELLDGLIEIIAPLLEHVEFDRSGGICACIGRVSPPSSEVCRTELTRFLPPLGGFRAVPL